MRSGAPKNKTNTTDGDRKILGDRLRQAREYVGFSQSEIAAKLCTSRSALSLMEAGQRKVEVLELKKLAGLYGRPLDFFTGKLEDTPAVTKEIAHIARQVAELAPEDRDELTRFAEFLQSRKAQKKG